ncbi:MULTISPECIES: LysR family transcriptional regulator [Pandoraea]|nr:MULTISPECIES: LysR family transcriptional regulator [Pandoraea]MDM8359575.1 LysR family transcriptional regulator [Pandoraea communis]
MKTKLTENNATPTAFSTCFDMRANMQINMRQIEIFDAVMRHGGFTAAAQQLHVSTPNVSKTISLLEYRLGISLFHRTPRGIRPTQAALSLHEHAKPISQWVNSLNAFAESLRGTTAGRLRIVSTRESGIELIPIVIADICRRFPAAQLTFECLPKEMLATYVEQGRADLAVTLFGLPDDDFGVYPMGDVPLVAVFRNLPALSEKLWVGPKDLAGHALVSYLPGSYGDMAVRRWFGLGGLEPDPTVLVRNGATACSVIEQQSAVAIVDGLTARSAGMRGLHTLPIAPPMAAPLVISRRRDAVSTPLTMTFELKFRQLVDCWFGDPLLGNDLAPQTERLTS